MDPNQDLLEALEQGNQSGDVIRDLLQLEGVSVNYCSPGNYQTPLHIAAVHGCHKSVGVLLSHGAHVNAGTADLVTPLHEASLAGHYKCVQMLIDAGAEVNLRNIDGSTPLCYASAKGCMRSTQLLISAGAEVNPTLTTTFPPLHEAVLNGNLQCAEILLKSGANLNKSENQYGTALHVSCLRNDCSCTRILLLAGANPDCIRLHQSPLHLLAHYGCQECVALLVVFGANVHKRDLQGRRAIDITDDVTCKHILKHAKEIPRTLLQCCRLVIRKVLAPSHLARIDYLPIPRTLKRYLSFADITEEVTF